MAEGGEVIVELFGVPRLRAGQAEVRLPPGPVRDVLTALEQVVPGLAGVVRPDGRLAPHYLLSLDGQRFLTDLDQTLHAGDRVLLLSADAGG